MYIGYAFHRGVLKTFFLYRFFFLSFEKILKMKKLFFLIVGIAFCSVVKVNAQFHDIKKVETAKELQKKKLLVSLSNEAEINAELEKLLPSKWTFTPFKVIPEKDLINYKGSKEYMSLRDVEFTRTKERRSGLYSYSTSFFGVVNSCNVKKSSINDLIMYSLTDEGIMEENPMAELLRQISLVNSFANYAVTCKVDGEIGFKRQMIESPISNISGLEEKTLMIRESYLKGTIEEVKGVYKGKVELATEKQIAEAILQSDDSKAILSYSHDGYVHGFFIVMSPANGHIYHFDFRNNKFSKPSLKPSEIAKFLNPKK